MSKNMSGPTIVTGALLLALGIGFYALAARGDSTPSVTAAIPAFFGLPILALGLVARNALRRKHAMHGAATLGLLAAIGSLRSASTWPLILTGQGDKVALPLASWETLLMFLICVAFVLGCVQSFRSARRSV